MTGEINWEDSLYPARLRLIDSPPEKLYYRSSLSLEEIDSLFSRPAAAVVGSRRMSSYGRRTTEEIVKLLVKKRVVIVSGMARGVDGVAHRTAIRMRGKTVAVLGSGIDLVYPPENDDIYRCLSEKGGGVVLSEFPPGTAPEGKNFPQRNRLIAGLVDFVVVVEAARKSGSLITARLAAEQGKDVFAVPGPVDSPLSAGTNWLISQGAIPLLSLTDFLLEALPSKG